VGLRERKRRKTVATIHGAAMRLFAERGYHDVTVTQIAEAAEVSRATVFAYFGSKEEVVFGEGAEAAERLREALADAGPGTSVVVTVVRSWVRTLAGWVEPEVVLQRRLAAEVPAVGAARARVVGAIEDVIAEALERELGDDDPLAPRLAAGVLSSALVAVEREAAARMEDGAAPLAEEEVDALFDAALAFVDGGLERLSAPRSPRGGR
jgi:AcrR family transcriptional regulator